MESGDETGRPVALTTFAVLAVLGFVATVVFTFMDRAPANPQQPDAVIAAEVETDLAGLAGVEAVEVTNTIECVKTCRETRQTYLATVQLRPDVTPKQISAIVSTHDAVAPPIVGINELPMILEVSPDKTLSVAAVHYGFGVTQADAYLAAVKASAGVAVGYGPPAVDESPLLTIDATLPGLVCSNADTAMSQVVPAVSAAATAGGIPFGTVRFDCGAAVLEAGIAAGAVYQPGWSQVATSVDRLCREENCGEPAGVLLDAYVAFEDSSTVVTVVLNDGQQLPASDAAKLHAVVDALSAAGAANPQLDLSNY